MKIHEELSPEMEIRMAIDKFGDFFDEDNPTGAGNPASMTERYSAQSALLRGISWELVANFKRI